MTGACYPNSSTILITDEFLESCCFTEECEERDKGRHLILFVPLKWYAMQSLTPIK